MQAIDKIAKKFEETTKEFTNIVHHRFARSAENIAVVSESIAEDRNVSIPSRSRRILPLDLYLQKIKSSTRNN